MTDPVTDNSPKEPVATDVPAGEATTAEPAAATPTVEEQLATEREARKVSEKSYSELRSLNDRRFNQLQQEIRGMRGQVQPPDPEAATATAEANRLAALEERQAITDFRVTHADHAEHWNDMLKYAQDNPHQVVARREDGAIDYQNTLDNAYSRVKLQRYDADRKKAQETARTASTAESQRTTNKARGTISGDTTAPPEAPPDVANMTADEMILAGLIDYDKNDPPEIIRKQRRGLVK